MRVISKAALQALREAFPANTRVELIQMDDPFNTELVPGSLGTVRYVDDTGSIHVAWDCGSSLAVVYGVDICRKTKA